MCFISIELVEQNDCENTGVGTSPSQASIVRDTFCWSSFVDLHLGFRLLQVYFRSCRGNSIDTTRSVTHRWSRFVPIELVSECFLRASDGAFQPASTWGAPTHDHSATRGRPQNRPTKVSSWLFFGFHRSRLLVWNSSCRMTLETRVCTLMLAQLILPLPS